MKNLFIGIKKTRVVKDLALSIVLSVLNCGFTHIMSQTIERLTSDVFTIFVLHTVLLLFMFTFFLFYQAYHMTLTEVSIENGVYKYYMQKLYYVKPSILKKHNTGYMAGLLNKLVVRQSDAYSCVVCFTPIDVAYLTYFTIILWQFDWRISIIMLVVSMSGTIIRSIMKTRMRPIGFEIGDSEGNRTKLFTDVVSNIETVQKMSVLPFMERQADTINASCLRAWHRWAIRNEISGAIGKFLTFSFGPLCLLIMYFMDRSYVMSHIPQVALVVAVAIQMPHNAKSFSRTLTTCYKFRDIAIQLENITAVENMRDSVCTDAFSLAQIDNVTHNYTDAEKGVDIEVTIPHFEVHHGEKICITGESGQGKTTLLNILSGCIESSGATVNGSTDSGRLDCIFISQDVEIFDMSLRDNLCLGNPNIPEDKMEYLLRTVGLSDWFNAIGCNWDVPLGERGVFVSTGQRQRLNLCRGLLAEGKEVYLLDEPTSNVDDETEKLIVNLLATYLKDKTVVIVTHRPLLRTICDYEYKFTNGVLSERIPLKKGTTHE